MFEEKEWHKFLPSETELVNRKNLEEFFYFMYERQEIWYKRFILKQPAPWTADKILASHKFTNVYRELDNSSQYLIHNVYLKEPDLKQVIFSIIVHRIFNKAETFEKLGGYPDYRDAACISKLLSKLEKLEKSGFKTLNQEAYKINTYIWGGEPRWQAYTAHIIKPLWEKLDDIHYMMTSGCSAETIINKLRNTKGVGLFLAHEYYQDFCDLNTYFKADTTKFNKNSWTNCGPGCSVGVRLIFPSLMEREQIKGIYWLQEFSGEYLRNEGRKRGEFECFKFLAWDKAIKRYYVSQQYNVILHMIEFVLCEFQKYKKMQWGVGKQRSKFKAVSVIE